MDTALIDALRAAASRAFRGRPVLAAYAFGNRVSGRPLPGSEVDVGSYLRGNPCPGTRPLQEEMRLAGVLSAAVGYPVDFRSLAGAPLDLRGRILEEGVRIFSGHDVERVALERDTLGRHHDYKDEFSRMHAIRLRRVAVKGL